MKNEIIELKKRFFEVLGDEPDEERDEKIAGKMSEIIEKNQYSSSLMMSLNIFSALKEI
jgi:hypothetical protein